MTKTDLKELSVEYHKITDKKSLFSENELLTLNNLITFIDSRLKEAAENGNYTCVITIGYSIYSKYVAYLYEHYKEILLDTIMKNADTKLVFSWN